MPFKSKAQRRYMYSQHPEMAKRWEEHTSKGKQLPDHVKESAYQSGQDDALIQFGFKTAGVGSMLANGASLGLKALGTLPTGVGNAVAAGGNALLQGGMNAASAGPGLWNKMKAFGTGAAVGATAGIPGGAGMVASTAGQMALPHINSAMGVQ